ncbi:hypothetical protein [Jidongwangia harbinensis]|uniref:hypothetical protein n=1 Tax=Jidongwangia harbinensis TaxID=2878561 RepID=UPI001CD93594|nr:hypothetical protein [Jidongwangia harbinensis]MCA2217387.1 hypothetical protein [Jidongwangia harbinensis]
MNDSDGKPSSTARTVLGLLSRTGPEVPPDVADAPASHVGNEPTELLPVLPAPRPAPKVEARAVIVYEAAPRPRRGLWIVTAVVVALTAGVVLGQTSAYRPATRSVAAAQAAPLPSYPPLPSPPVPSVGVPVTAPLGPARTRLIEVAGAASLVQIRSMDLGPLLFSAAELGGGGAPAVVHQARGPRLDLGGTGTARTEILLNSAVRWTVRLTGRSAEQLIDMRAGGLAGIELTAGAGRAVLDLPAPARTVPLRVAGPVDRLQIRPGADVPVRLRLGKGADTATFGGTEHRKVKPGRVLTSPGWRSARNRYDLRTTGRVESVFVTP